MNFLKNNHYNILFIMTVCYSISVFYGEQLSADICFFIVCVLFVVVEHSYKDMEHRKDKRIAQVRRLREMYKELQLGIKK